MIGKAISGLVAAVLLGAGVAAVSHTSNSGPVELEWINSDHALILGPTGIPQPNDIYVDAAVNSYLDPLGFHGDATSFFTPETSDPSSYTQGLDMVTQEVINQWNDHQFSAADPLWLFGYSQSTTILGNAEQAWSDAGIPQDAIHLVMVGDSSSALGGFTNTVAGWLFHLFGFDVLQGAVTPNDLYQTDVFTIPGDGYADAWGDPFGMLSLQHEMYLGLSPDQVSDAIADAHGITDPTGFINPVADGLTNYYEIDLSWWDQMIALWDAFIAGFGSV